MYDFGVRYVAKQGGAIPPTRDLSRTLLQYLHVHVLRKCSYMCM